MEVVEQQFLITGPQVPIKSTITILYSNSFLRTVKMVQQPLYNITEPRLIKNSSLPS